MRQVGPGGESQGGHLGRAVVHGPTGLEFYSSDGKSLEVLSRRVT